MSKSAADAVADVTSGAIVQKTTVFLVDDDPSLLAKTSRLVRACGYPVRTFTSATEFLRNLKPEAAGCAVMGLQMPEMTGLELQRALLKSSNPLPVIFLTESGSIPATVQAMRLGAEDFLTKNESKGLLLSAVRRAILRNANERRERARREQLQKRFATLTPRELEVLSLVMAGQPNKQIAVQLGVTERTIKLHRTSITRKAKVRSLAELIVLAHEAGLGRPAALGNLP